MDKTEESDGSSELLRKWPTDLTATRLSTTMAIYFTQETQSSLTRGNRRKIRIRRELSLVRLAENRVEFARQARISSTKYSIVKLGAQIIVL